MFERDRKTFNQQDYLPTREHKRELNKHRAMFASINDIIVEKWSDCSMRFVGLCEYDAVLDDFKNIILKKRSSHRFDFHL